ncbi:hypothetical protein COCSADRAFT_27274 [Bipolaris sorokiniana ND90Pr]|uniref:Uncharacterized protein n=1 Tax=Cochliobolus sativus (strain ND90Pr / ATCC 201652) TaxID=665912 RepID=M2R705_COCSN|nr:uncharacterized protein COCSADRAFT_27274 [Bipolaris sorokiniana ND90Pr]EMD62774.1 hypothetical protein COCSADRAFT_27274 [Bipolaris sorokiniana ND90Pr]
MGELVQSTIKEGLILTVVTSLRDITVLKAFTSKTCGFSSFRYDIVMFEPELGAVVTGRFMATAQPICRPFGERVSFLKHVESIVRERKGKPGPAYVETVPLVDYLFRYYDDNRESTQDYASISQYVALPAEALEDYVKDAYWQFSSHPVRITRVDPHSTFSKRGFGMPAASEDDLWHVEQLDATERKNQCQNIDSLPA